MLQFNWYIRAEEPNSNRANLNCKGMNQLLHIAISNSNPFIQQLKSKTAVLNYIREISRIILVFAKFAVYFHISSYCMLYAKALSTVITDHQHERESHSIGNWSLFVNSVANNIKVSTCLRWVRLI